MRNRLKHLGRGALHWLGRPDRLAVGAIGFLVLWAVMVALVVGATAIQRREAPDNQFLYEWQREIIDTAIVHKGLEGWDVAGTLERFYREAQRPYQYLAVLEPDGKVVASFPGGWEGKNAKDITIGESTLWDLTYPMEQAQYQGLNPYPYTRLETDARFPYSGQYVVGDSLWIWPHPSQYGRLVSVRPAMILGKPFWSEGLRTKMTTVQQWAGLAFVSFLAYWICVALWVFRDARRRGERALAWGLIALATNAVGLAAYLLRRSSGLRAACTACTKPLERVWSYCPHCGTAR